MTTAPADLGTRPRTGVEDARASVIRSVVLAFAVLVAFLFLAPLLWTMVTSVKPPAEASASPPTFLPSRISLGNYELLATFGSGIGQYIGNSAAVAAMTIVGTLTLGTLAGYGFSRFRFPFKNVLFVVILGTLMIPFQSILIPLFLVLNRVGLNNSLFGLALVYTTFQLPFAIFMMRNAFDSVPREIEEAALVDGCGPTGALGRVMIPLVVPGMVTVGLFAFLAAWNEFFAAIILLGDTSKFTLPVLLLSAQNGAWGTIQWGALQAGVTITAVPAIILFLALQRYYISGLQSGAVKA